MTDAATQKFVDDGGNLPHVTAVPQVAPPLCPVSRPSDPPRPQVS
jgi:hypothetical protein